MRNYIRFFYLLIIIIALGVLLSPLISLFLPEKLRHHTYQRLMFNAIVDRETKGCKNKEEKILALFNYVIDHEFAQGIPYSCKPLESLIYGEAYCDFQARTLNLLLAIAGVPSRYAMLLDENGISPHTVNEVFLYDKWCVFDTTMRVVFKDSKGFFSLEELSYNPELLLNVENINVVKQNDIAEYENYVALLKSVLSVKNGPRRSKPYIYQAHIFDNIADIYFKIFKNSFVNFYQDIYLVKNKKQAQSEDSSLFYSARSYHLAYRLALALQMYDIVLNKYPESRYRADALFFKSLLYYENNDYAKAIALLKLILEKEPVKWRGAVNYYLTKMKGF